MEHTMPRELLGRLCLIASLLVIAPACIGTDVLERRKQAEGTREMVSALTAAHAAEGKALVERYERVWHSLEAYHDPSLLSDVALGPDLEDAISYRTASAADEHAKWGVARAVTVTHVEILEVQPERIKLVADVEFQIEVLEPSGTHIDGPFKRVVCDVYVFRQHEGQWKYSAKYALCTEDYDFDWEYHIPDDHWLKREIGDLPSADLCHCEYWSYEAVR
jgi:hypothetical protein